MSRVRFLAVLSLFAALFCAQIAAGQGWVPSRGGGSGGGGGGGGASTPATFFPYVEMVAAQQAVGSVTCHLAGGNQTSGCQFALANVDTMTGVKTFWFTDGTTYTLKCSLWDVGAGTRLASGTVGSVNTTGLYTCSFTSAYTFSATQQGQLYDVTVWETSGAEYTSCNGWNNNVTMGSLPLLASPYHIYTSSKGSSGTSFQSTFALYAGGDAKPTGAAGSEAYVVEPIWQ